MSKWIVIDLDGTLSNGAHRVHLAQAKQWEEYNAASIKDTPHERVAEFLRLIEGKYMVLLVTGRDERNRNVTVNWLIEQGLYGLIDEVVMRPKEDRRSDGALKVWMVDTFFGNRETALHNVLLALEDRDNVVLAYRDAGFICWQVNAGEY